MPDVFTQAKRSEVMSRIRGRGSEFLEVKVLAAQAEVVTEVSHNAARNIARMPRKRDQAVGAEGIGVMPMAAGGAEQFAADFLEPAFQLPAVPGGVLAHNSGGQDKLVAKRGRDGPSGFQQCFQMGFGRLLEAQDGFAPVASMGMAAGEQSALGNPDAVLVAAELNLGKRHDHGAGKLTRRMTGVKESL